MAGGAVPRPLAGVIVLLTLAGIGLVLERHVRMESLRALTEDHMEGRAEWSPNYRHIWFAHDAAFAMGGRNEDNLCSMGHQMDRHQKDWAAWCKEDEDFDGLTNGEELGDPCCLWSAEAGHDPFSLKARREYRRWDLSHPSNRDKNRTISEERKAAVRPTSCDAYDPEVYARQFKAFYFRGADGAFEPKPFHPAKIASAMVLVGLIGHWLWRKQLAVDLFPWFFKDTEKRLSPRVSVVVFFASYVYMDLTSGIVHLILDYAPNWLPGLGSLARGFQYHHHDPTAIIRISWYEYVSHVHLLVPLVFLMLALSNASRVSRLFWFWGSVNVHVFQTAHRWAHFPPEMLPSWVKVLQASGVVLTHERHMSHHEDLESQFTILSGKADIVLDNLSRWIPPWRYDLWACFGVAWFVFPILLDVKFRHFTDGLDHWEKSRRKIAMKDEELSTPAGFIAAVL